MAFRKKTAAQCGLVFDQEVNFSDLDSSGNDPGVAAGTFTYELFDLPAGAVVTGLKAFVTTAFNSATTDSMSIGDTPLATRYMGATDVKVAGDKPTTVTGYQVPAGGATVKLVWTNTGAVPTAGRIYVVADVVIPGKEDEVFRLPVSV